MNNWLDVGCSGGSCPKQENCSRYLEREERSITLQTPPFNSYPEGTICGYQTYPKKEDQES